MRSWPKAPQGEAGKGCGCQQTLVCVITWAKGFRSQLAEGSHAWVLAGLGWREAEDRAMGLKMHGTTCSLWKHRVVSHPTGCRTTLPVPTSVQHHLAAAGGTATEVCGTKHRSKSKRKSPATHWDLLNYIIKGTGSKVPDSSGSAERMGTSHRYTQTRWCKPRSGKHRELQTCQVSTSESIFLPEILPNTPLHLRAKHKPCFVSLPCITIDSRLVFCTWQQGEKADIATGKITSSRHTINPYRWDTGELWSAFLHPCFLAVILCRPSWVVEGEGQPTCWHTVFLEVRALPLYQFPAYLLHKFLWNIKISTECKNWCIAGSSTEQVTNNPFLPKQTVSLSSPLKLATLSRYLS